MNFADFKESTFFKLGLSALHPRTENLFFKEGNLTFDASLYSMNDILQLEKYNLTFMDIGIKPHLYRSLIRKNSITTEWKNIIITQWDEVNALIKKIPYPYISAQFTVQSPDNYIIYHTHSEISKHVLTFVYTFDENYSEYTGYTSWVKDNKTHRFNYPSKNKFFMSFYDNVPHDSKSNIWRFFWVYDFYQYVEEPIGSEFYHFNLHTDSIK